LDIAKQLYEALNPLMRIACGLLIVLAFSLSAWMWWESRKTVITLRAFRAVFFAVSPLDRTDYRRGLAHSTIEELRGKYDDLPADVKDLWDSIDQHVERYTSPEGAEGWFLTLPPRAILTEEAVVGRYYHGSFHQAVPGLLTAIGLLLTFVSILLALVKVHVEGGQGAEIVTGTNELINGLSAKFISSILGLLLSIAFVFAERKGCERRITREYEQLTNRIADVMPVLTPTRIQLDIQMYASRQATSMSNISSDFVNKFTGVFEKQIAPALSEELSLQLQKEFRPTMQQMASTLERLQTAIERLEAQKQESVTGELRVLLESLEAALRNSLDEMGRTFHKSLTTAASEEFTSIAGTLHSTGEVLRGMNTQFDRLQVALEAVILEARRTTESQFVTGREQTQAMTTLMEGLMVRLNESAQSNLDAVTASLVAVVNDLSAKVNRLSDDMVSAVTKAATESSLNTKAVVASASQWSESTAQRLETLVEGIAARSEEFRAAGKTLLASHDMIRQTLQENQHALSAIRSLTTQLDTLTLSLVNVGKISKDQQDVQLATASLSNQATTNLKTIISATLDRHESLLREYATTFEKYRSVFIGLDKQLSLVFDSINDGMLKYNSTVEANFRGIVDAANKTIPPMAAALRAETDQLAERLDDLSDVLDKGIERLRQ
jgi:hypothetical protein